MSLVHFLLVDFGEGSCSCSSCDRGKTKSTPSLTRLRLEFDKNMTPSSKLCIVMFCRVLSFLEDNGPTD